MDEEKKTPLTPELTDEGQAGRKGDVMRKGQDKPLAKTISPFSGIPVINRVRARGISSWRKVVREEAGLMDDLGDHARASGRLRDVDIEIETEHLQRVKALQDIKTDLEREKKFGPRRERLEELGLDADELEIKARLDKLKNPPEEQSKIEKLKQQLRDKISIDQAYKEHELEKIKNNFKQQLKTQQAMMEVFEELAEEILKGRDPAELKGMELKRYENLQDLRDRTISGE